METQSIKINQFVYSKKREIFIQCLETNALSIMFVHVKQISQKQVDKIQGCQQRDKSQMDCEGTPEKVNGNSS